jgi:hypothetical protein
MDVLQVLIFDFQVFGIFVFDFPIQVITTVYVYTLPVRLLYGVLKQTGLTRF